MADSKPLVILTRKLPDTVETRMRELFNTELNASDKAFDRDQLIDAMRRAEVLVPTVTDRIDAELIKAAGPVVRAARVAKVETGKPRMMARTIQMNSAQTTISARLQVTATPLAGCF